MTFEEIREMINATITENGQRQITGKALNLALLEIITAIEENKPEGGGAETVYIEETLTPEHQAVNAATYAKCKVNVEEDKALPVIVLDTTQMLVAIQGMSTDGVKTTFLSMQVMFIDPSAPAASDMGMTGLLCQCGDMTVIVNEDGSITMM